MPRPLRKARRVGANALPTRPARTARRGRVTPRRPRLGRRNKARQHEAATNPQRRAWPAVGNRRQKDHQRRAARPRAAKIPLANVRPAAKPALARPSPIRQTVRKGRLNFLYFGNRPSIDTAGHRSDFAEAVAGEVRRGVDASMPAVAVEDSQDVFRPAQHRLRQVLHVECSQNDACPGFVVSSWFRVSLVVSCSQNDACPGFARCRCRSESRSESSLALRPAQIREHDSGRSPTGLGAEGRTETWRYHVAAPLWEFGGGSVRTRDGARAGDPPINACPDLPC